MSYNNFSIVIPVYNEKQNIENLIKEINQVLNNHYKYEIVLVNDNSTDGTNEILRQYKKINNYKVIKNDLNKGQSYSIHEGISIASYDIIITIDADGQNNPKDIPNLINIFNENNYSLVGGIRKKRKDNLIKKISSIIANKIRSFILNDQCSDTGCSLKVFDKHIFLQFPYFDGIHRFLPALFTGYGHKTKFINVDHRKRLFGKSKYGTFSRMLKGIRDIFIVKRIIRDLKKNK